MKLKLRNRKFISFQALKVGDKFRRKWLPGAISMKADQSTAVCLMSGIISSVTPAEDCEIVDGAFTPEESVLTFGSLKAGECFYRHGKGEMLKKYIKCQSDTGVSFRPAFLAFCIDSINNEPHEFVEIPDDEKVSLYIGEFKED